MKYTIESDILGKFEGPTFEAAADSFLAARRGRSYSENLTDSLLDERDTLPCRYDMATDKIVAVSRKWVEELEASQNRLGIALWVARSVLEPESFDSLEKIEEILHAAGRGVAAADTAKLAAQG